MGISKNADDVDKGFQIVREFPKYQNLPIVLSGPAVGGSLPRERRGMRVLERIDQSVAAVQDVLAKAASTAPV